MNTTRTWRTRVSSDLGILILLALARLDDARYLAWGYVAYLRTDSGYA